MKHDKMDGLEKILAMFKDGSIGNMSVTSEQEEDDSEWDSEFWIIRDRPPYRV